MCKLLALVTINYAIIEARNILANVLSMASDIVKLISLLSDPKAFEHFKKCFHDFLEYPRLVITSVLTKVEELLTEDVRLRAQHRVSSQKLKQACVKVLEYIDLTELLLSMVDHHRRQSIFAEITNLPNNEAFDNQDRQKFPQTIDFIEELEMRLNMVMGKYAEVQKCCDKLLEDSSVASGRAQAAENRSKWWKYGTRAAGALSIVGGIALSGGLGAVIAGGGLVASYFVSKEFAKREKSLKEVKQKMDEINKAADELVTITRKVERMRDSAKLDAQKEVVLRKRVLVSSMKQPLNDIFDILQTNEAFDNEKEMVCNMIKKYKD